MTILSTDHLDAVKKLIERYNSISEKDIYNKDIVIMIINIKKYTRDVFSVCDLCRTSDGCYTCNFCIHSYCSYVFKNEPNHCCGQKSFASIYTISDDTKTAKDLVNLCRKRAIFLQKILDKYYFLLNQQEQVEAEHRDLLGY